MSNLPVMVPDLVDPPDLSDYYFFVPNRYVWDHWKEFMKNDSDSETEDEVIECREM